MNRMLTADGALASLPRTLIEGYLTGDGYDFVETSSHIQTIDGARGHDTVGTE